MLTRSLSQLVFPLSLALAVPALGCGGGVASEQAASAESATTRAPVAPNAHGPLKVVGEALGDVPLTEMQRTQIEKLALDADSRHADARAARQDLMLAVAAEVQAGAIDRPSLQPKIDALAAALTKAQPADRASFEQLHAILSADQRTTFVDALKARIGEHKGKAGEAHPLKQLADDLKLTDDQRAQIRAAMHDRFHGTTHPGGAAGTEGAIHPWMGAGHHGGKVLSAFTQDRFVMDEVAPASDVSHVVSRMSEQGLGLAETVLPMLTPDQRVILANKIRDKADSAEMGPSL